MSSQRVPGRARPLSTGDAAPQPPRTETPDDHVLIASIASGESAALEALYDRYSAAVYRMSLRIVKNREIAEDVTQEVFWRVWRRASSFERERGRVAQWVFGIAHNLCIDELRRMRARPTPVYEDVDHPVIQQLVDEHIDVPATVWSSEQHRLIVEVLAHLPVAQRQAIELAYFGGMSHQEIATRLDRPLGTIKTRVRLGLQKMNVLLAARGFQTHDSV